MNNTTNPNEVQGLMKDILVGLKAKLIKPVLDENNRLAKKIEDVREKEQLHFEELMEKMLELEQKIEQSPVLILEAIRSAIEQTGES